METETTLLLDLDERNLAHFLSALALAALADRVKGNDRDSRRCWWPEPGHFAIRAERPRDEFCALLFDKAYAFLTAMEWHSGLGGEAYGVIASNEEEGVNPFVRLNGNGDARPPLRTFAGRVIPRKVLPAQKAELRPPSERPAWLGQLASGAERRVKNGVSSWGYDCRVNTHASDAGISSDAEGSGCLDPIYPAIELLSFAGAAFFAPAHTWTSKNNKLHVTAWTQPLPLGLAALASSGRVRGVPSRSLTFLSHPCAHGEGTNFRFFPPAMVQPSTP